MQYHLRDQGSRWKACIHNFAEGLGGKDVGWNNFGNKRTLVKPQAKGTCTSTEVSTSEWVYTSDTAIHIYWNKQINKWVTDNGNLQISKETRLAYPCGNGLEPETSV